MERYRNDIVIAKRDFHSPRERTFIPPAVHGRVLLPSRMITARFRFVVVIFTNGISHRNVQDPAVAPIPRDFTWLSLGPVWRIQNWNQFVLLFLFAASIRRRRVSKAIKTVKCVIFRVWRTSQEFHCTNRGRGRRHASFYERAETTTRLRVEKSIVKTSIARILYLEYCTTVMRFRDVSRRKQTAR